MRLIEAEKKLLRLKQPILQTSDVAAYFKINSAHASKILGRLVQAGKFVSLMRGKWITSSQIDPLILPEYLTSPFPAYVSLQTALYYHGMISQIPNTIYAISLARTRQYVTSLATISIHHVHADFFFGFETQGHIKIATAEKALIDVLYLTAAKSNLFKALPELEFPSDFDYKKAEKIIKKIPSNILRKLASNRLDALTK